MDSQRLVFGHTVQGLFVDALGPRLTPESRAKLKAAGIDIDKKLLPAYDQAVYHRCVEIAAAAVWPALPRDEALRNVGEAVVRGYEGTLVGKAVIAVIRMIGPRRALERSTHNFRSATNYLETTMKEVEPGRFEIVINETSGVPTYFEGVLCTVLSFAGATEIQSRIVRRDGGSTGYELSWQKR